MSSSNRTAPVRVIASCVAWRHDGTNTPVVRIAGPRGTIFVGQDDLPALADALAQATAVQA